MFHLSPVVAGVFPRRTGAETTFVKQVGFADYYFGTRDFRHKLGLIQSLPVPGPKMLAKAGPKRLPAAFIRLLRQRILPLCGIVEDLPNPANRVMLGQDSAVLRHSFPPYDMERGRKLARLMKLILKRAGAMFCLTKPFMSEEHAAHQCGTLRFGTDSATAVADADCRMFGQPNVFIVDGSIFPDVARCWPGVDDHGQCAASCRRRGPRGVMMSKLGFRTKLHEMRLASRIHGGVVNMWVAAMGVKLSRLPIPSRRFRTFFYRKVFGKKYAALDEAEFERPIWSYPSLNALFTRGLQARNCRRSRPGRRAIPLPV